MPAIRTAVLGLAVAAGSAAAQVTTVTVNLDGTSQIAAVVSQDAPVIAGSDSFTTGLTGFAVFEIDEGAGTIAVTDFMGMTTSPVNLNYTGFLSELNIDASELTAEYAGIGASVAVPYAGSSFDLLDIPTAVTGTASAVGSIFLVVSIDQAFNFADFGAVAVPSFAGTLENTGGDNYALASSFQISSVQPFDVGGGTIINITIDATVNLNGTGTGVTSNPDPRCNAADVAPDFGVLNVNDVIEFVNAFNANDLAADVAPFPMGDGLLNVNDVIEFVNAFNAGCP